MKNKGECAMSKEQEEMQQATEEHIEQPLPDEPKEEQSEPMAVLADIRGCANKDLLNALSRKE